ncbi:hypothetical protein [Natrinema caseinilyticum]|uniref:hypothetical protein n=1 Tax=Natrinema caseinilyticum TaxID=2961570 RepID=UPI0020C42D2C|nr:hypothetical protein [Natrinema caseinilyticum]
MKRTTLIAAVCAVLVLATGFAAAAPGNVPVSVDTGADDADDQRATGEEQRRANEHSNQSESGTAADGVADERTSRGPSVDLPEHVPDHVSAIHDRISAFLSGDLEGSLGDAISEITPDDGDEAGDDADGSDAERNESDDSGTESDDSGTESDDSGTESDDSETESDDSETESVESDE